MRWCVGEVIEFMMPLPPPSLRSNSRAHWRTKVTAKQAYSRAVFVWYAEQPYQFFADRFGFPWKAARVTYTWRHAGVAPDLGNIGPNVKALQDILCMAPKTRQANGTTYLGLIEDDKGIEPVYKLEKVARRAVEGILIQIERREP